MARRNGSKKQVIPPTPIRAPKLTAPVPITKAVDPLLINLELHALFNKLQSIHDVLNVCIDAAQSHRSETETEVAGVLRRYAATPLYSQLSILTKIIESLGGKTSMSVGEDEE